MDWPGDLVNDTPRCLSLLRLQVACDDAAVGAGYLMYSEQRTFDRFEVPPLAGNADHIIAVTWHARGADDHPATCPLGQVRYGDGSACRGGDLPNCALWGNPSLARCPDDGGDWCVSCRARARAHTHLNLHLTSPHPAGAPQVSR